MTIDAERIRIELAIDPSRIPEACAVMHQAFAVYNTGQPSGALLETPETLKAEVDRGQRIGAATLEERMVAIVKHAPANDGTLFFGRLSVASDVQGQGLARVLLASLRQHAHDVGLSGLSCHVRAANTDNIALYEHLGMQVVERLDKVSLTGAVIPVVRMADAVAD
ncbi:MAG: hypothetical protein NVSMB48_10450 [Marmoricola sp.]